MKLSFLERIPVLLRAAGELGIRSMSWYGLYHIGLKSGIIRWRTPAQPSLKSVSIDFSKPLLSKIPDNKLLSLQHHQIQDGSQVNNALVEAEEIVQGKVRLFGGPPVDLSLSPIGPLKHWTHYTSDLFNGQDIKFIWEPARLGWSFVLGRAYQLNVDERYPLTFWRYFEEFISSNPTNTGPNWSSAQEVGLRILAMAFAIHSFAESPSTTPQRRIALANAVRDHAMRIPPTLCYARSQNNNHLLSEATGLFTAGCLLHGYAQSRHWRHSAWHTFNQAIHDQIAPDGTYVQHSMNYHRFMLHLSLWMYSISKSQGLSFPPSTVKRLQAATHWLLSQLDPISGRVPNLGHNDGSYILPLVNANFDDYRPVAQAASRAFLGQSFLPPGPWDELCLWLGIEETQILSVSSPSSTPSRLSTSRLGEGQSWATLRAAHFPKGLIRCNGRPAHADQLHVDLWWAGQNVAADAGSYLYNAPPPWDNRLSHTLVHNTVEVDGQDQMQRAGRFLWLNWSQGKFITTNPQPANQLTAEHDGYHPLGVHHRRSIVCLEPRHWQVKDYILPTRNRKTRSHSLVLQWLLPDCSWKQSDRAFRFNLSPGEVILKITAQSVASDHNHEIAEDITHLLSFQLVRAGQVLAGNEDNFPTSGWISPTYGVKLPALSLRTLLVSYLPVILVSDWRFIE